MTDDPTWTTFDPREFTEISKFIENPNFQYLDFQASFYANNWKHCYVRTGTPERPLKDLQNPKSNTELYATRHFPTRRLLICIGESFTWTEGLYGLASGVVPPKLNPAIQLFFTIQGRLSLRFRSDLRTVTYPGNSNSLMIQALDRVLQEISNNPLQRAIYKEIIILHQFTDRSRCELNHPETPWIEDYFKWYREKNFRLNDIEQHSELELFLVNKLNSVLENYKHLPLKCWVWRNFNPWITQWNFPNIHKVNLSMNEFKFLMQGIEPINHPVMCSSGFYSSRQNEARTIEEQNWLLEEIEKTEYLYDFFESNELGGHPRPELAALWAEYLIDQGVKFGNS